MNESTVAASTKEQTIDTDETCTITTMSEEESINNDANKISTNEETEDEQNANEGAALVVATVKEEEEDGAEEEKINNGNKSWLDKLLFTPVDISPLVYFRLVFGMIMLWEVWRYIKGNRIKGYYVDKDMHFKYYGFEWVPGPLPGMYMYHFYVAMGILYTFIIMGLFYKVSMIAAFLGFFYWMFLDETFFLNHFYLALLIHFVMIFLPAHRNASMDVLRYPELRVEKVPSWTRWILVFHVSVPYVYGGVSKFCPDWLAGYPMKIYLDQTKRDFPLSLLYQTFTEPGQDWWVKYFFSYGGLVFDLVAAPALIWKKSRPYAVTITIFFHMMNDHLFSIGIFPWFMMYATPIYFEPEWSRPILNFEWIFAAPKKTKKIYNNSRGMRKVIKLCLITWCTWQVVWPFRQFAYPGDVNWGEEGHLFAWMMMIRNKRSYADFTVTYLDTGREVEIDNKRWLTNTQASRFVKRPDMILRFGHFLCEKYAAKGRGPVTVHVDAKTSLNEREYQHMVDPTKDLCMCDLSLKSADWIVQLKVPLNKKHVDNKDAMKKDRDREREHSKKLKKEKKARTPDFMDVQLE